MESASRSIPLIHAHVLELSGFIAPDGLGTRRAHEHAAEPSMHVSRTPVFGRMTCLALQSRSCAVPILSSFTLAPTISTYIRLIIT